MVMARAANAEDHAQQPTTLLAALLICSQQHDRLGTERTGYPTK